MRLGHEQSTALCSGLPGLDLHTKISKFLQCQYKPKESRPHLCVYTRRCMMEREWKSCTGQGVVRGASNQSMCGMSLPW